MQESKEEAESSHDKDEGGEHRQRLVLSALSGLLIGIGFLVWQLFNHNTADYMFAAALVIAAYPVLREVAGSIKSNPFNADLLMVVAGAGAAALGAWEEGAAVLALYNIAEVIEDYVADRARHAAEKISKLIPGSALIRRDGREYEVPVEEIRAGDIVLVKSGSRLPIDGLIVKGSSAVDQSIITGESLPVAKKEGDSVISGSLAIDGSLEVKASKAYEDSLVRRIIHLVTEAREKKTTLESFADRVSKYYTPAMIIVAVLIALLPPIILSESYETWAYRALVSLIISCPSAFLISIPTTTLFGLTRAMWNGILVKGGIHLENAARIKGIVFDKTGTLTTGTLAVTDVKTYRGYAREEVLKLAAGVEKMATHPIGQAILRTSQQYEPMTETRAFPGRGVIGFTTGKSEVIIGSQTFLAENRVPFDGEASGTAVYVAKDKQLIGSIELSDEVRPEARDAVNQIRELGIHHITMLTGDSDSAAKKIAESIGVDYYYANLLPEDKLAKASEVRKKHGAVMAVGDGVNDAPLLARSEVGVAMGAMGNDVAVDAADVAIMNSSLLDVPRFIRISRKVVFHLKVNLVFAFLFKGAMLALGVMGVVPLWGAVIADDGVTVLLVLAATPILRYERHH
ncbi:MAG: cadmium-translocating P-type ATPase [Thaumarchaeota archaeon]|nr:cadmium-translocating P-type ATPase [Nitrososphaerota archaeon]